jgi:hypothetical protein
MKDRRTTSTLVYFLNGCVRVGVKTAVPICMTHITLFYPRHGFHQIAYFDFISTSSTIKSVKTVDKT